MKGSATVTSKADTTGKHENDVRLPRPHGKVAIEGNLTPEGGTAARITPKGYETTEPVLDGAITTGLNYTKFTVTPNGSEQWERDSDGYLKKK